MGTYSPITDPKEIMTSVQKLSRKFKKHSVGPLKNFIGHRGGGREHNNIYWNNKSKIWNVVKRIKNRYWNAYGTQDPRYSSNLNITCEVNPPIQGVNRRCAGIFLKNKKKEIFLAHTGKIGGGGQGIGKNTFSKKYKGKLASVDWPDGIGDAILIGDINKDKILENITEFAQAVENFKGKKVSSRLKKEDSAILHFSPEFAGQINTIESKKRQRYKRIHGEIVNSLHRILKNQGYKVGNDQNRDLFLASRGKRIKYLFEAKTGTSLGDIYTGVGQLLIHGSVVKGIRRVLVLPRLPKLQTIGILKHLGIEIIRYKPLSTGEFYFLDLKALLK